MRWSLHLDHTTRAMKYSVFMRLCGGNDNLQRPKSSCHHLPTLTWPNSHWMLIETGEGMTRFRKWDADDFISIIPAASPVLYLHSALPHQLWCLSTRWIIIVQIWSPASHWKCTEDCGQNDFMDRQKQSARHRKDYETMCCCTWLESFSCSSMMNAMLSPTELQQHRHPAT